MSGGGSTPVQAAPEVQQPQVDMTAMMAPMMGMMQAMTQISAMNSLPQTAAATRPVVETVEPIDWASRQKELQAKIETDTAAELMRRKGRSSTVLTSPLADGEEIKTTAAKMSGV